MKKQLTKICAVLLTFTVVFSLPGLNAYAYVYNSYVLSNPGNIRYVISASASPFASSAGNYIEIWHGFCSRVNFTPVSYNGNITISGDYTVHNGTYATCFHNGNNYSTIVLYYEFAAASTIERAEVIVHEVGHSLGLAHCQPMYDDISVMRETGFNGKPYPLSDDILGINNLY